MLPLLASGSTLCGVSALVLMIVSTATHFWMLYSYFGKLANQGLWRLCINHKCYTHTVTAVFWNSTGAIMLLSIFCCLLGVVMGLRAFGNRSSRRVQVGGIFLLLSGFLALLALSVFTGLTVKFFGKRYLGWRFSWSYILAWVACTLAFTAGVFQLCVYRKSSAPIAPRNVTNL